MTAGVEVTPFWDGRTRTFDGGRLHRAILARGWTVEEFALACRPSLHPNTIHKAIRGGVCWDSTVLRIYDALERRKPGVS